MQAVIGMVILILDIIAILDLYKSQKDNSKRILWLVIILILPLIGMLAYFLVGKKS